jgi:hypothetical protein
LIKANRKATLITEKEKLKFQVEDTMFLRLTPSKGSLKHPKGGELSSRFIGPFQILERVNAVIYRLDLSDELTGIHDMFHVSQLKKYNFDSEHGLNEELL